MSTKPTTRGQRAVDAYIKGMSNRNELLPQAAEYLAKRFACSNPHGGLRAMVGCISHGDCRRYLTHSNESPARAESPLRALVRRLAPAFTSVKAADDYYSEVAIRYTPEEVEREPERVAEELWDRLQDDFEHRSRLIEPPPLDRRTARVREALDRVSHHLAPGVDLDSVAHAWRSLGDRPPEETARAVATRLGMEQFARDITRDGRPVRVPFAEVAPDAPPDPDALRVEFAKLGGYEKF
jgi:hypothetical protein